MRNITRSQATDPRTLKYYDYFDLFSSFQFFPCFLSLLVLINIKKREPGYFPLVLFFINAIMKIINADKHFILFHYGLSIRMILQPFPKIYDNIKLKKIREFVCTVKVCFINFCIWGKI